MSDEFSPETPIVAQLVEDASSPFTSPLAEQSPPEPLPPAPVSAGERIDELDTVRGFALLGILVMNIQSFAMIGAAYMNPSSYGDLTGANYYVWYFSHLLVDMKFMAMFSMLFGAGIVLMAERREQCGARASGLHYRRMGVLAVFGLLHAYLLWEGDILFSYAICGMILYPLRRLRPATLVATGLAAIAVASILWSLIGWSMQFWPSESMQEMESYWQPTVEETEEEIAAVRGGWVSEFIRRAPLSLLFQSQVLLTWGLWRAGGLMLLGMAFAKIGFLYGRAPIWTYAVVAVLGMALGFPIIDFGVRQHFAHGWATDYSMFLGTQYNYWASLLVSLGWVGIVILATKTSIMVFITRPLAAVGRMALTNYLLHSLIATTIFYGHGLGYFGSVERTGQILIVAVICLGQLVISPLWLRWFRFGPAEWLWRTISYGRPQPMWRSSNPAAE